MATAVARKVKCDKCRQVIELYKGDPKHVVCEDCRGGKKKKTKTAEFAAKSAGTPGGE